MPNEFLDKLKLKLFYSEFTLVLNFVQSLAHYFKTEIEENSIQVPSFDLAFKSPLIGLSNNVSFASKLFSEGALISKNILLKTCCTNIHVHQCKSLNHP